jgi:hypothetical protein
MRWTGYVVLTGERRGDGYVQDCWRRETKGKRPLGRIRDRWGNNIKIDLQVVI